MIKSKLLVLFLFLVPWLMQAQTVTTFEGIDASNDPHPEHDVDHAARLGENDDRPGIRRPVGVPLSAPVAAS